jgi:hypothetical protein
MKEWLESASEVTLGIIIYAAIFIGLPLLGYISSGNSSSSEPSDDTASSDASYLYDSSETAPEPDYNSDVDEPSFENYGSDDMDCDDFDTQEDAQDYYENVSDDNLDGDEDGIACESLN